MMLTVTLELFGDDGLERWEAASPDMPGIVGSGATEDEAVDDLVNEIEHVLATVTIH